MSHTPKESSSVKRFKINEIKDEKLYRELEKNDIEIIEISENKEGNYNISLIFDNKPYRNYICNEGDILDVYENVFNYYTNKIELKFISNLDIIWLLIDIIRYLKKL